MFIFCSVKYRCWKTKNIDLYRPLRSAHEGTLSFPRYSRPVPPACYVITFHLRIVLVRSFVLVQQGTAVGYWTSTLRHHHATTLCDQARAATGTGYVKQGYVYTICMYPRIR